MPNIKAAKKAMRQAKRRTARNLLKKRKIKDLRKSFTKAIEAKSAEAAKTLSALAQAVDKAAKARTIHPNKASRIKSRLQKKLNAIGK